MMLMMTMMMVVVVVADFFVHRWSYDEPRRAYTLARRDRFVFPDFFVYNEVMVIIHAFCVTIPEF